MRNESIIRQLNVLLGAEENDLSGFNLDIM
jgi:hypothetical protein